MENKPSELINCCFCDKDLSPGSQDSSIKIIKYKCPGCERIYCSARCSEGHKEKYCCLGSRDRTPYVPLSKFDQKQFLDDYFFLESVNEKLDSAHRTLDQLRRRVNKKSGLQKRKFKPRGKHPKSSQESAQANQS